MWVSREISGAKHVQVRSRCQPGSLSWVDSLIGQFLPAQCPVCEDIKQHTGICVACLSRLPVLQHACRRCALALQDATSDICGQCLQQAPEQQRSWAAYHYQNPLRKLISDLKFQHKLHIAQCLGTQIARLCPTELTPANRLLVPAPLHLQRLRERGFNQARELSRPLARERQLETVHDLLIRCRATQEQSRLNARQRKRNVSQAFACREKLNGEAVILFDDVMTTGATMQAMARCLKAAGAGEITAICVARA